MMRHLKLVSNIPNSEVALDIMRASTQPKVVRHLNVEIYKLQQPVTMSEKSAIGTQSYVALGLAFLLHVIGITWLLFTKPDLIEPPVSPAPMMVSLVENPVPEPEVVPLIPPPQPVVKQKKVVKKVVKKLQEVPQERVELPQEVPVEPEVVEPIVDIKPSQVVEQVVPAPKQEVPPIKEEIEPPQFGIAYLNNPAPNYPAMSRRLGEEGRVLLRVLVKVDGHAESVQLEKSSGFERLDRAAIEVVESWTFIPAKKGKQAISAYVLVPVKFTLDK